MSSQIVPFQFEGVEEVRVVIKDGNPWFVAADLCAVLGIKNVPDAVRNIPERDKGKGLTSTPGGPQAVLILSEPGMWRLVIRSDKPRAIQLQQWIAEEVIPSIRKSGAYVPGISADLMTNPRVQQAMQLVHFTAAFELAQAQLQEHTMQLVLQNQKLAAHDEKLKALEETTAIIDGYVTIKGAAKKLGVRIDTTLAGMMGTVAGKRTKAAGLLIRDVPDLQHGTVHTYPREIAEESVKFVTDNEPQRLIAKQEAAAKKEAKKLEKMKKEAAVPVSNGATQPELQLTSAPAVTPQA